jgi:hypothetical protein
MSTVQLVNGVYKAEAGIEKGLKPDENGYYTVILGGLNCYNSAGAYYVARNSTELFTSSSELMRRIKTGQLRGELGHPKRDPGSDLQSWLARAMTIDEQKVACHISEVWLDHSFGKNNPKMNNPDLVAIYGKVRPSGPFGQCLKETLENPKENAAFSIRALTEDKRVNGRLEKTLVQIITWDYVNEPGLSLANKWGTPTLEDRVSTILESSDMVDILQRGVDLKISQESASPVIQDTIKRLKKMAPKDHISSQRSVIDRW